VEPNALIQIKSIDILKENVDDFDFSSLRN